MEVKASAKYLRTSPRKLRLLTQGLRGLPVEAVLNRLAQRPQKGNELLRQVVKQAMANAKANFKLPESGLVVKRIEVGEGPVFKRMDKSHGARFDRGVIKKKTAHIFLTLTTKEEKPAVVKEPKKAPEAEKKEKRKTVSKKVRSKLKAE